MSDVYYEKSAGFDNPEALEKRFLALPIEMAKKGVKANPLSQALFQTMKIAENRAKQLAPSKTGRLRNAIKKRRDKRPHLEGASENYQLYTKKGKKRSDLRGAYYWTWVHFGSIRHKGVPYLTMAFEETKEQMSAEFKVQFLKKIELLEKKVQRIK